MSICVSGVIHSRTFTIPSAVGGSVTLPYIYVTATSVFAITVTATSSCLDVEFNVNESIYGIEMVKLELGTVSTLHLDPPMDHAVELPKCQRFYAHVTGALQYAYHVSSTAYFMGFIAFPVTMRINPTIVYGPCTINNIEANMQGLITSVSVYNNREISQARVNKSFTGSFATPLTLNVTAMADL